MRIKASVIILYVSYGYTLKPIRGRYVWYVNRWFGDLQWPQQAAACYQAVQKCQERRWPGLRINCENSRHRVHAGSLFLYFFFSLWDFWVCPVKGSTLYMMRGIVGDSCDTFSYKNTIRGLRSISRSFWVSSVGWPDVRGFWCGPSIKAKLTWQPSPSARQSRTSTTL